MSDAIAPPPSSSAPTELVPVNVEDEMQASYLDYAMSVIIGRALPDVRDGFKPVHRRVLFAMHELGNAYNRAYKKSARVVGDVIGKYHPHGDQAVYDTLVRMAQTFSMSHVLVDGQGNFGSVDGDPPAAMRYTEVRLSRLAGEMLADIDKDTVRFAANYDESLEEPVVLPARFPNLLVNGSAGIAVGMATNIPPHNLAEVIDAAVAFCGNSKMSVAELMQHVRGPDFPTGGMIYGTGGLRRAYETGRGVIRVRGVATVEDTPKRQRIVVTELPYQVNKATLLERIAELVREKRVVGISDIRDESDRDGMRIAIDLRRDANPDVILNQLYAMTSLQSSFGLNLVAIVGGRPKVLSLVEMLSHFVDHRRDVVTRRSRHELSEAEKRFNVVFGLLAAIDSIDRVISIIRGAADQPAAKAELMAEALPLSPAFRTLCEGLLTFKYPTGEAALQQGHVRLNEAQAQSILDMRLARLTGLERDKLGDEAGKLRTTIEELSAILSSQERLMQVIVSELEEVKETYGIPRRTQLVEDARQMSVEDLIADEDMVVTVSHAGYVKRAPVSLYQAQRRGGRGKTAATTREEDFVETFFVASTHSYVMIFTDRGKVYWLRVYEVPEARRASRGKPIINLCRMAKGEKIAAVLPVRDFVDGRFVVMGTANGIIKKTDLMAFSKPRPSGLVALTIEEGDRLINVGITEGNQEILVATRDGLAIRFPEEQVRSMGRTARGVKAISFKKDGDAVVGMEILSPERPDVLTVTASGSGKRTSVEEYRLQSRGGSGIFNFKLTDRSGQVVGVCGVNDADEVMLVTDQGMMIRMPVNQISRMGRATQGVRVITTRDGARVASVQRVEETENAAQAVAASATAASQAAAVPVAQQGPEEGRDEAAEPSSAADSSSTSDAPEGTDPS